MTEDVKMIATPVPGLRVTYQMQIGDGRVIAYEAAVDSTIDRQDLDELLDRCGGAAERRQAVYELPMVRAGLYTNRELLAAQRKARATTHAQAMARHHSQQQGRRNVIPMAAPDANAIAQFDQRILDLQRQIRNAELRIPYLEAVIARQPPPELFPEAEPEPVEAAEAAE